MTTHTADERAETGEDPHRELRRIQCSVPIGATAPALARDLVARLSGVLASGLQSHAQLLVSELVSHRVRRVPPGREGALGLEVSLTPSRLRVQVTDDDGRPLLVEPAPGEPTLGWELQLVAELADRWGVRHDDLTTLWFELDR